MSMKQALIETVKDSPQISAVGLILFGVSLEHWVLIFTAAYGVFRLATSMVEFYWKIRDRNERHRRAEARLIRRLEEANTEYEELEDEQTSKR